MFRRECLSARASASVRVCVCVLDAIVGCGQGKMLIDCQAVDDQQTIPKPGW